jgi:hypothetical protein
MLRVLRMTVVALLAAASVDGSLHLGSDYWRALFGIPDAQWHFSYALAPIIIGLGAVATLIASFPRPSLSKFVVLGCWAITLAPVLLSLLVLTHAY